MASVQVGVCFLFLHDLGLLLTFRGVLLVRDENFSGFGFAWFTNPQFDHLVMLAS